MMIMKKGIILSITCLLFFACKKDEKPTVFVEPIDTLPPYTDTGANTMGCVFGAKVISAVDYIDSNYKPVDCFYYESDNMFWIYGVRASKSGISRIQIVINGLSDTGIYVLKDDISLSPWNSGQIEIDSANIYRMYTTTTKDTGFVHIRKLDKVNKIISGEFYFNSIDYYRPISRKIL